MLYIHSKLIVKLKHRYPLYVDIGIIFYYDLNKFNFNHIFFQWKVKNQIPSLTFLVKKKKSNNSRGKFKYLKNRRGTKSPLPRISHLHHWEYIMSLKASFLATKKCAFLFTMPCYVHKKQRKSKARFEKKCDLESLSRSEPIIYII